MDYAFLLLLILVKDCNDRWSGYGSLNACFEAAGKEGGSPKIILRFAGFLHVSQRFTPIEHP